MFAVHDPINIDQKDHFSERAYVAEIRITKKGAVSPLQFGNNQNVQALRQATPDKVNISVVLESVNPVRISSYSKLLFTLNRDHCEQGTDSLSC